MNPKIRAILKAAAKVMAQKGFEKATMDEIAKISKVAKGTLYYYFKSKEELFLKLTLSILEELEERTKKVLELKVSAAEKLRALIKVQVEFFLEFHEEVVLVLGDFFGSTLPRESFRVKINDYYRLINQLIAEGIKANEFREVNLEIFVPAFFGMTSFATIRGILREKGFLKEQLIDNLTEIVLNGLKK
ncbi:TetR/AcrR family transcriptional regulator [Carboxydothermus ferrireducens]|uniref:AcrR family transcriptional regulator n=1 Tax=Carboxydothermus ferrireducens DSM 11255 TaxID=1119529 RepID=A0ABX2R746_9THEO|nr:TetR/AcrR family transcriptional regulator [Carboxydothermus ferrireducens]NYE56392.1 AcrR family transcriptional regulator [Carboxydothermus ferrireducens DSM 11255]